MKAWFRLVLLLVISLIALAACGSGGITNQPADGEGSNGSDETTAETAASGDQSEGAVEADLTEGDPITLIATQLLPEQAANSQALIAMGDYLSQRTDGRITLEYYWSGSLVPADEQLSAVGSGLANLATDPYVYNPQALPIANWTADMTSIAETIAYPYSMVATSAASTELFANETILEEYRNHGIIPLFVGTSEFYNLICKEPVTSLEDAQGLRVRSAGATWAAEIEALGMIPVSLPPTEQYEALQRGLIDCTSWLTTAAFDLSLFEVAPHVMFVPFSPSSNPFIMTLSVYESMSPEDQALMWEAAGVFAENYFTKNMAQIAADFGPGGRAEQFGVEVHAAPELTEALQAHQAQVHAGLLDRVPEGLDAELAETLLSQYRDSVAKWSEVLRQAGFDDTAPEDADTIISQLRVGEDPSKLEPVLEELRTTLLDR